MTRRLHTLCQNKIFCPNTLLKFWSQMEFGHSVEGLMEDEILFFSHSDILKSGTLFKNQPKCRI